MEKFNKFLEYIGIAVDGDIIALGGAALPNCNTREAVFILLVIAVASCQITQHIVHIIKMG